MDGSLFFIAFSLILGNERVIGRLVSEGDPLVDRVISWAESVKKTLSGKGEIKISKIPSMLLFLSKK